MPRYCFTSRQACRLILHTSQARDRSRTDRAERLLQTDDFKQGVKSIAERRPAKFPGKISRDGCPRSDGGFSLIEFCASAQRAALCIVVAKNDLRSSGISGAIAGTLLRPRGWRSRRDRSCSELRKPKILRSTWRREAFSTSIMTSRVLRLA